MGCDSPRLIADGGFPDIRAGVQMTPEEVEEYDRMKEHSMHENRYMYSCSLCVAERPSQPPEDWLKQNIERMAGLTISQAIDYMVATGYSRSEARSGLLAADGVLHNASSRNDFTIHPYVGKVWRASFHNDLIEEIEGYPGGGQNFISFEEAYNKQHTKLLHELALIKKRIAAFYERYGRTE